VSDLFRRQAVDEQRQRFHGAIVLSRTWSPMVLTLFLCGVVGALVAFAFAFGFTRHETVNGVVIPDRGLLRLTAAQAGVVTQVHVAEGQLVQAGDPLFTISSEKASPHGDTQAAINATLQARVERLQAELAQHEQQVRNKAAELNARIANTQASLQNHEAELRLQQQRLQVLRDVAQRYPELVKTGAVSEVEAQEKAAEVIDQQSRLTALQRSRLALQRELGELQAALTDLPLQAEREASGLQRDIEALAQERAESEAKRAVIVRAAQAGRVATLLAEPGQSVAAAQALGNLLPTDSTLEAELYAPTRAIGFVHPGTEVQIRYDAYPYQKFGQFRGEVREVSASPLPGSNAEPLYRIRVRLDAQAIPALGAQHRLKPGMQLAASLVLEHRTLAEWALEPLFSMTGRLR
jgi:membrane fusion protein